MVGFRWTAVHGAWRRSNRPPRRAIRPRHALAAGVLVALATSGGRWLSVKRTPRGELMAELSSVMSGGSPLSAGVARTVLDTVRHLADRAGVDADTASPERLDLTDRERDVLRCLVDGMGYAEAAAHLGISPHTVRTHIRSVYSKLQVHSIAQAVSRAIRDRLV